MCGCNGKPNHSVMSTEELIAEAQKRADERRAADEQNQNSQQTAIANSRR